MFWEEKNQESSTSHCDNCKSWSTRMTERADCTTLFNCISIVYQKLLIVYQTINNADISANLYIIITILMVLVHFETCTKNQQLSTSTVTYSSVFLFIFSRDYTLWQSPDISCRDFLQLMKASADWMMLFPLFSHAYSLAVCRHDSGMCQLFLPYLAIFYLIFQSFLLHYNIIGESDRLIGICL